MLKSRIIFQKIHCIFIIYANYQQEQLNLDYYFKTKGMIFLGGGGHQLLPYIKDQTTPNGPSFIHHQPHTNSLYLPRWDSIDEACGFHQRKGSHHWNPNSNTQCPLQPQAPIIYLFMSLWPFHLLLLIKLRKNKILRCTTWFFFWLKFDNNIIIF